MKTRLTDYFNSWWLPAFIYLCLLVGYSVLSLMPWETLQILANILFGLSIVAFFGLIIASIANFMRQRWLKGIANLLLFFAIGFVFMLLLGVWMLGFTQMQDGFADNLTIPEGIEIAEPERVASYSAAREIDEFQAAIRAALSVPGNGDPVFTPMMPSLRKASTDYYPEFVEYLEASPDWHVFSQGKERFAARRWSRAGEPENERDGWVYENGPPYIQTRCLLSLDRKQWRYERVQPVQEGKQPVLPTISVSRQLHESRVMIDAGGVWVEVFEESDNSERRITKATVASLEREFSRFVENPAAALTAARARSRELAARVAGDERHPFRLLEVWDPGQYDVAYSLNPGEPGLVYLKAFEVTRETPLSARRLKTESKTRLSWSTDATERFWGKESFTIFEGDWGKPYAARFEVWFDPDSGQPDRKLAQRVYKIEGWQR